MDREQAQQQLDRAKAWLLQSRSGTPEYFSKACEKSFALRRLEHLAIDTMDAIETQTVLEYCERVLSSAEHHSESVREDVRLKLRHAKARLIAIV